MLGEGRMRRDGKPAQRRGAGVESPAVVLATEADRRARTVSGTVGGRWVGQLFKRSPRRVTPLHVGGVANEARGTEPACRSPSAVAGAGGGGGGGALCLRSSTWDGLHAGPGCVLPSWSAGTWSRAGQETA